VLTGTVLFPSDSTYRGDVALVQMFPGKSGGAFMYSGVKPDETSASTVHSMWGTIPVSGEQYCTGGSNTYAICGWSVDTVRTNWQYSGGEWALNVTKGLKSSGTSINGGDSGGPVYTVEGTTIAAKGIIRGGTTGPASCSFENKRQHHHDDRNRHQRRDAEPQHLRRPDAGDLSWLEVAAVDPEDITEVSISATHIPDSFTCSSCTSATFPPARH
jgi:hypothetical protein